jgi:hypothetical protein
MQQESSLHQYLKRECAINPAYIPKKCRVFTGLNHWSDKLIDHSIVEIIVLEILTCTPSYAFMT